MIESSQENTKSAMEAARWLGVSYATYRKYAKMYGIFENHLKSLFIKPLANILKNYYINF